MRRKRPSVPGPFLLHMELLRERITNPNAYPYNLPAVRHLTTLAFHPKVTFFIGENGSGKSTLLEAIAVACGLNPEGGSRHFNFATRSSHSTLSSCLRIARKAGSGPRDSYFLRAETFYNVATTIERLDNGDTRSPDSISMAYGDRALHEQSHGESFFALFRNRLRGNGLYLMDEPEAALSPNRQLEFLATLHEYVKLGGQFIIATHSPIIMAYPNACIYHLSADGICETAYTNTEHYVITRAFLTSPQLALKKLCADTEPVE